MIISDYDGDEQDYFEDIDFEEMTEEELASLAPRRRYLIELERMLDVDLPATRKTHVGDNWKKSSPNITNADLKQILIGVSRELGEPLQVAKELRREIIPMDNVDQDIFRELQDAGDEGVTAYEIGDALDLQPDTVRWYIGRMREKIDIRGERDGKKMRYRLPPGYRDVSV
ncbi:MAG: hypothetical protein SVW02_04255 [Candidatus Nanohaloarchaea archaeon]|nr:hypothetical protein [Candidatus Nanohaloarchaea archaeon]